MSNLLSIYLVFNKKARVYTGNNVVTTTPVPIPDSATSRRLTDAELRKIKVDLSLLAADKGGHYVGVRIGRFWGDNVFKFDMRIPPDQLEQIVEAASEKIVLNRTTGSMPKIVYWPKFRGAFELRR